MTHDRLPVLDGDRQDARLLDRVRPAAWPSAALRDRHDLVVVGGGTAGLVSASIAAALGARVALVERALLGGDCLVTGCVPSKALLRSARAAADVRAAAGFGVNARLESVDFAAVMERMRALRADIAVADSAEKLAKAGVDVIFGQARFVARDALDVGGRRLRFRRAILATGARAAVPPIDGLAEAGFLTNETVFNLTALPARLVILGGGPVGCELAQAFARLGSDVTLVQRGPRLLPRDDPRAAQLVEAALAHDGVRVLVSATARRIDGGAGRRVVHVESGSATAGLECDAILVAVGRAPNVEDLGLDAAKIDATPRGVVVDDRLRTTNRRVFAAGDVASAFQFTHAADALARIAVQNALFPITRRVSSLVIPWCTYTSPEVAHVGVPTDGQHPGRITLSVPLEHVDRAVLDGAPHGFARVVADTDGRILGATIVSERAGETIALVTLAMANRLKLADLDAAIHCYPTHGEVLKRVAAAWQRTRLKPWMPKLARRLLRLRF